MRVESDGIRGWQEHLERLTGDSAALFARPVDREEVVVAARHALAGEYRPVLLRLAVTASDHTLGHPGGSNLVVTATCRPAHQEATEMSVVTATHRRSLPGVKHLGITPELAVRRRARLAGHDDALFVAEGVVTEGPTWSLVLRLGDELVSPLGGLPGVTVGLLAGVRQIVSQEVTAVDLERADAAVAVNAGWGVRGIASIDGRTLPRTQALAGDLATAYRGVPRDQI